MGADRTIRESLVVAAIERAGRRFGYAPREVVLEDLLNEIRSMSTAGDPSLTERVERLERTLAETVASVEYLSGKVPDATRRAAAKVGGPAGAALEALAVELGR